MRRQLPRQQGQTLYILVITIMVMMMVVGLAVDGGLAYYYQSRLDTASQAAADAGTAVLWEEPELPVPGDGNNERATTDAATQRALNVAAINGMPNSGTSSVKAAVEGRDAGGRPTSIHVHTTFSYPVFFIKLLTQEPRITLNGDATGQRPGVP